MTETKPEYRLQVTTSFKLTARRCIRLTLFWTWPDKESALTCKSLLEQAKRGPNIVDVKFVEHVPDKTI